jgi:predicted nucleic acid-binding protein
MLVLLDTSIWIELLNGRLGQTVRDEQMEDWFTCGPVIQEVYQGMRELAPSFRVSFESLPRLCDPISARTFIEAAEIYRLGRRKGLTIRSSTDCLIAAIALDQKVPVWHRDRDFEQIAKFTALETVTERT